MAHMIVIYCKRLAAPAFIDKNLLVKPQMASLTQFNRHKMPIGEWIRITDFWCWKRPRRRRNCVFGFFGKFIFNTVLPSYFILMVPTLPT